MDGFFHAISSVSVILLLTATGYFCAAMGWLNAEGKKFISKFLMTIAVPSMCVYSLNTNITREMIGESLLLLFIPFSNSILCLILSGLLAKLMRLPRKQVGVFMTMCSLSNCVFIGFGMCTELFGDAASVYVTLFYLINTIFIHLVSVPLIRWSSESEGFSGKTLRKFLKTPSMLGILTGLSLVMLHIKLPQFLLSFGRYMNNLVSPLALLLTGFIIHEIGLRNLKMSIPVLWTMGFRFLLAPALCILLCAVFDITGLARSVFIVESAMPVITMTVVAASEYGADEQMAAQGAAITTLACFIVIPVLMLFC